ncbi:unnamed protein product [Lupinus luteus]|uniref:Uncharacterized protein n=1 Tax=Lupinus luteus TaxID=3873 RepID=A0AAV1YF30_LUPLU
MDDKASADSSSVETINGKVQNPIKKKRKYKKQKKEFDGWGSTSLIRFLQSIGRDTSNVMSQSEVTNIVNEYVKQNNLIHATKKKRIMCDQRLHLLFGRKSIGRLKVGDLLEPHFVENRDKSDDDIFFNSDDDEEEEDALRTCQTPKSANSERKSQPKKLAREKPRSCFAAIVPFNIKLVYLRKSLVEELLKDPETFETKVVGGFIRIKCDPNDYLQKNSHQLLQVTGVNKGSGITGGILLEISGFFKDVSIKMLSDDNFSEEECKDLHQRVKDGLVKRPMIVDIEQTARALHEDMTKHWLARELTMLQNLIDRANEKGWRRELYEYLQKREKLQSPVEQERLLHEIPQAIAEDLESESPTPDVPEYEELESPTPCVPDKRVEDNLQELRKSPRKQASSVTEVPKAVADVFLWKATEPDVPEHQELESPTPDVSDKRVKNNLQELWRTTSKRASVVTEVPKAVADVFLWKATKPDVPEDLELESPTPNVPDKRVENNLQELWKTTSKRASLVTEVPKAVADVFLWKATRPDVSKDLESEYLTPDVPDKRVENNLQELWKTTSKRASLVTEVPKAVADVFLWKATKPNVPEDLNLETLTPDVPDKRVENNLQESRKTTSNQISLVSKVPKAVADGFLWKATKLDIADLVKEENNSPKSTLGPRGASEVPPFTMAMKSTMLNVISRDTAAVQQTSIMPFQQKPKQQIDLNVDLSDAAESNEVEISQGLEGKPVKPSQPEVIELSDDDDDEYEEDEDDVEDEKLKTTMTVPAEVVQSLMWYYRDPQGTVQGPFSLTSLKRWSEENYFPPNFMVWKAGQSPYEAALLVNILHQFFPS